MQPCSQPRYGFKLVSKPTSGLLLCVMIDLVPSRKYCVARRGRCSASGSSSTTSLSVTSTCSLSKRFAGLQDAPRPRTGAKLCGVSSTMGTNFFLAGTVTSSCEHIPMSSKSFDCCYTSHRSFVTNHWRLFFGRGGRAVDCAGLENRKAERPREFESHPLRLCQFMIVLVLEYHLVSVARPQNV